MSGVSVTRLSQPVLKSVRQAATRERARAMQDLDPYSYVSCWTEEESINGEDCEALVLILATKGCSWALRSGCSMCGYTNDSSSLATDESIWIQYQSAMKKLQGQRIVKIYTSGSFLDKFEISPELKARIIGDLYPRVDKIVVETRHEYITRDNLESLSKYGDKLMLAVGLESSNDVVLNYSVNKPSNFDHFRKSVAAASRMGFGIKSYLMLKPPFMSEGDAIEDAVSTAKAISEFSDSISINPTNIQKDTVVELLWRKGNYRPPWLWSVVEALVRTHEIPRRVLSKPTGAGTIRGAHNCGRCDERVMKAIADYSKHRHLDTLTSLDCGCKKFWQSDVLLSGVSMPRFSQDYRKRPIAGDGAVAGI